jgi:hypothetical protein
MLFLSFFTIKSLLCYCDFLITESNKRSLWSAILPHFPASFNYCCLYALICHLTEQCFSHCCFYILNVKHLVL